MINNGLIDANVAGVALLLDPSDAGNFTNNSDDASLNGGGILQLTGNGNGTFDNTNGVIEAVGAGSEVQLFSSASVTGGTVRGTGDGLVRVFSNQNVFFTDVTFEGAVQSDDNTDFGIAGTITNNATITVASLGSNTDIEIQGDTAINGSGKVVLSATAGNNAGVNGSGVLTNGAGHTFEGQGTFGENTIGIINNGLIDANVNGAGMVIDPDSSGQLVNNDTMRASNGGVLVLTGNGTRRFRQHQRCDRGHRGGVGGATVVQRFGHWRHRPRYGRWYRACQQQPERLLHRRHF